MMKTRLAIILVVELLVAFWIFENSIIDDWALAKAISDWRRNPSTETRAAYERAGRNARWMGLAIFATLFGVMAVPTVSLVVLVERRKSKRLP